MRSRTHGSLSLLAVAAIISLAMLFNASSARAVCPLMNITNNTGCTLDITFFGSGATFTITNIVPGTNNYPFNQSWAPMGIITALGHEVTNPCATCVVLHVTNSTNTCCANICPNGPCTLVINPVTCTSLCQ
jgi:hypothetical protein